jgi:hypothetical protein
MTKVVQASAHRDLVAQIGRAGTLFLSVLLSGSA